jgi:amino acid permease
VYFTLLFYFQKYRYNDLFVGGNIGNGIPAMTDAFKNAGLVVRTIGTLLMGIICTHCIHMLV